MRPSHIQKVPPSPSALCGILCLALAALSARGGPDLASSFDAGAESWRATDPTATLAWQSTGGTPGGYVRGGRSGCVTGRLYCVETSPGPAATGTWSNLTNDIAGTGQRVRVTDASPAAQQSYRLKAWPVP
jgi:hypothetical protein